MTDDQRRWQGPQPVPLPSAEPPATYQPASAYQATFSGPEVHRASGQMPPPEPPRPDQLRLIAGLLVLNLTLSIVVTVVCLFARHSIVNYQLDHRHITDPASRQRLRGSYVYGIIARAIGNVIASVVYLFLVRALFRGRRWAYRRVIWLGAGGGVALLLAQVTPYPLWLHGEQLAQAVVLGALVYLVTRPAVRGYFAPGLPGRDVRRFRK